MKLTIILIVMGTVGGMFFSSCSDTEPVVAKKVEFLTGDGKYFVNESGEKIILKGCNLGSWLNLEMWMMDVKDESVPDQYTFENIPAADRKDIPTMLWNAPLVSSVYWADGTRSLADILRYVLYEFGESCEYGDPPRRRAALRMGQ